MENQRLILFVALVLILFAFWQAWETRHGKVADPVQAEQTLTTPGEAVPELPPTLPGQATADEGTASAGAQGQRIRVITDLLEVELGSQGGDIRKASLLAFPVAADRPEEKFVLMDDVAGRLFIAQSGMISRTTTLPDHHALYSAAQTEYRLADGQDELKVPLTWQNDQGVKVVKTLTFHRDSYLVDVDFQVENKSGQEMSLAMYRQLQRDDHGEATDSRFIYTFTGGVISNSNNKYRKLEFDDMEDWRPETDYASGGWTAMLQHYFLGAWLARDDEQNRFYTRKLEGNRYVVGMTTPEQNIAADATTTLQSRMYVGPKDQDRLKAAAKNLVLTVDYGILTVLAQPLFWLLELIHDLLKNWGWSIIVLTILIKLAFYKLTETQYRSMANMRRLQPKLQDLKERFGDDRTKFGQAMMELYKKEKVNPLSGCLPILIQIPFFIALYWVLLESVELRQADFMFWINDLSAKDPFFVLPVLMGVSMFIMQKLSPAPPDPIQAKMMMALPFVFTVFFAFFPSGLVLYWLVNNLLSLAQQWYITRKIEKAAG